MALTPEDVVNKRFQPTKFREGYDQDEVDDFLDEVVVELRRLHKENDELRARLGAGAPVADEQGSAAAGVAPTTVIAEPSTVTASTGTGTTGTDTTGTATTGADEVAPVETAAAPAAPASAGYDDETTSTASLLQLARRLHDEHVREGIEKRDALIAEGQAAATRLLAEAEEKQRSEIGALEEERRGLEDQIDGLRVFEREYREQLRNYIEGQLRDLDTSAVVSAADSGDSEHAGVGAPGSSGLAGN
ncbi:DivIVA domain-containing protein [Planctomonas deserti]|uniref:DivIVA domain-containing protein n=1 Tax=Planctomonas deserti TaxID=2144185 RepID=UPI000D369768|nr:DivIVA domain-containing protein [Planctomonas deserti]